MSSLGRSAQKVLLGSGRGFSTWLKRASAMAPWSSPEPALTDPQHSFPTPRYHTARASTPKTQVQGHAVDRHKGCQEGVFNMSASAVRTGKNMGEQ
eukprot:scaffold73800_cov24-Tisochrysis_lutea.AAC.1